MSDHSIDTTSPEYQAGYAAGHLAGRRDALLDVQQMMFRVTNQSPDNAAAAQDLPPSVTPFDMSVLHIYLPGPTADLLWFHGKRTLADVVRSTDNELARIVGIDQVAIAVIDDVLLSLGYTRGQNDVQHPRQGAAPTTGVDLTVLRLGLPAWIAQKLWENRRRTVADLVRTTDDELVHMFRGNRMAILRIDEALHGIGHTRHSSEASSARQ